MAGLPASIEARIGRLPSGLRQHLAQTRRMARELARQHGIDEDKADLGAACHDLARLLKAGDLIEQAQRYGLGIHPVELASPVLLHGPVAALWLEHEDGVEDSEVLEAVRWHSTGREGMGSVAKVVFLADKLDPAKLKRYPQLERVAALVDESLDRAALEFVDLELDYFLKKAIAIHPATIELRNELLAASAG